MKFEFNNNTLYLIQDTTTYTIPTEDIQRLIARPGTRVLRFKEKGKTVSIPLTTAIGEIEGYSCLEETLLD